MTEIFRSKLIALPETAKLSTAVSVDALASALEAFSQFKAVAVGSGGSAISASFLAACRKDISRQATVVATPMEVVTGEDDLSQGQIWLFTGRGENADIHAALQAALDRNALNVQLVTSNPDAAILSFAAGHERVQAHVLPVADEKDGFLSTHSLAAALTGLLGAVDSLFGNAERQNWISNLEQVAAPERVATIRTRLGSFKGDETVLLLADPALTTAAIALETSVWETALCAVQRTDYRNFAHGRHVWLAERSDKTKIIALTTSLSSDVWHELQVLLPASVPQLAFDYQLAGRRQIAQATLDALTIVEAIGDLRGVDPARPSTGPFARAIYDNTALARTSALLNPPARDKLRAMRIAEEQLPAIDDLAEAQQKAIDDLIEAELETIVLDYDGTVVATEHRFEKPGDELLVEIRRLLEAGMAIGVATGRGGSAAEVLRSVIPVELHARVVMGYYNGGYVQPLTVDIRDYPPPASPEMAEFVEWLETNLPLPKGTRRSAVQISIDVEAIKDPARFVAQLKSAPGFAEHMHLARSRHSVDVGLRTNSKLNVLKKIAAGLGRPGVASLCIGDSGHFGGNDFDLLGQGRGISVDSVCHRLDGSWSLFGSQVTGPAALLKILRCIKPGSNGTFRFDVTGAGLPGLSLPARRSKR